MYQYQRIMYQQLTLARDRRSQRVLAAYSNAQEEPEHRQLRVNREPTTLFPAHTSTAEAADQNQHARLEKVVLPAEHVTQQPKRQLPADRTY